MPQIPKKYDELSKKLGLKNKVLFVWDNEQGIIDSSLQPTSQPIPYVPLNFLEKEKVNVKNEDHEREDLYEKQVSQLVYNYFKKLGLDTQESIRKAAEAKEMRRKSREDNKQSENNKEKEKKDV